MFAKLRVSPARAKVVVREIVAGSQGHPRFYVLLIIASMIASFGLIANSAAVIIGAMLVSPLMTPIFGIALGMLRGNTNLWWRSLSIELTGIALAVGSAFAVGALPQLSYVVATPEMLARTQPNLLDLLVAVFAGFAGAYALLDARVSPALPGVAIATAIVPPLSTCGLSLAMGAWSGAQGAMLLFLANLVSILLVALVTFWVGGLGRVERSQRQVLTRLGPTIVGFIAVAVILTNSLAKVIHENSLKQSILSTLENRLEMRHGASLIDVVHTETRSGVQVVASVRSNRTISPAWVTQLEVELREAIGEPVELAVRSMRSRDVFPLGSSLQIVPPDLNGRLLENLSEDDLSRETLAAQVVRELFGQEPGFELTRIEYGDLPERNSVVVAYVNAIRRLTKNEIFAVEQALRERMQDPSVKFLIRVDSDNLLGPNGPVLTEWTNVIAAGEREQSALPGIQNALRGAITEGTDLIPLETHFNWQDGRWRTLVEVTGPRAATDEDIQRVLDELPEAMREKLDIMLWFRGDFVATQGGYTTYDRLTDPLINERRHELYRLFHTDSLSAMVTPAPPEMQLP